jgi:L-aspartate oxidase
MTEPVTVRHLPQSDVAWTGEADVVVVGSGAAGMSVALEAAACHLRVLLVHKDGFGGGSTPLAQGGLAAVLDPGDSTELHRQDTITAGAGLCDAGAVDSLVLAAPGEIAWLRSLGARFDPGPLGLEGGHSRRRIVHAGGDASGAEVHRALREAVIDSPVDILDRTVALDALVNPQGVVVGLLVGSITGHAGAGAAGIRDFGPPGAARLDVGAIRAPAVILASGGYGQAYATTTNPAGLTGDGLALAVRAGAEVRDVEFVQFHPTVLWQPRSRGRQPLVTEALRGAGAVLVDVHGRSVMAGVHPLGDLAPRDIVAMAMHRRMAGGDGPSTNLWLDATAIGRRRLEAHFPIVYSACRSIGIDPACEAIPVAPGAHYACGGIRADMAGKTTLDGLYAVGEVAATGVHGANRLASNSLTEAIATGRRLGRALGAQGPSPSRTAGFEQETRAPSRGAGVLPAVRSDLADAMSRHAGVLRNGEGLEHLLDLLAAAPAAAPRAGEPKAARACEADHHSSRRDVELDLDTVEGRDLDLDTVEGRDLDLDTVEATNLHTVSVLVAAAALTRTESRGCHRRSDAPGADAEWQQSISIRSHDGEIEVRAGGWAGRRVGADA